MRERGGLLAYLALSGGGSNKFKGSLGPYPFASPKGRFRDHQGGSGVIGLCFLASEAWRILALAAQFPIML